MSAFDRAMNSLDDRFSFLTSSQQIVSSTNEADKVLVLQIICMHLSPINFLFFLPCLCAILCDCFDLLLWLLQLKIQGLYIGIFADP